jgi:hypothetical protein
MHYMRYLLILLSFVLLLSCNKLPTNEITKVELATGSCLGLCPMTVVSIDSSLNLKFYGGSYVVKKGYYTSKITSKIWDSINIKLESIDYKNLYVKYFPPIDDQTLELIVHYKNNKVKHVLASSFDLAHVKNSNSTAKVFYWISEIYKSVKLVAVKNLIKFETTKILNPSPPKPKIDQVKFPPPIKHKN